MVVTRHTNTKMEALQMEAPVEGDVVEWQEGIEATGPVPLQALEVSEYSHA